MSSKPRILQRRLAARSRIFQIEAVDLEFANGERRTFERVLGGADSVMIVPLRDDDTLLQVHRLLHERPAAAAAEG